MSTKPTGRPVGRPKGSGSGLTPEVRQKLLDLLRVGNYIETAAECARVAPATVHLWRNKHPDFDYAVKEAIADAETKFMAVITRAAAGREQWQAAAWILERTRPSKFALKTSVIVEAELNAVLDALEAGLPKETFDHVLGILARFSRRSAVVQTPQDQPTIH